MPLVGATRAKCDPNLRSLSRIRYFGVCPYGVASRSCCATQGSVGERVTFTWMTFRDCSSMRKKAKSGRKKRSVTCKKSQAHISAAWLRKNVLQFCPLGRFERVCLIYFWMVRLLTRTSSLSNSPRIRSAQKTAVVSWHLLDQADRFWRKPRLSCMHLRFALPEHAEELTMEAAAASSSWTRKSACFQVRAILARSTNRSRSVFR
jgi:hypothetical protein